MRMAKIQNTDITKCWQGCGVMEHSQPLLVGMQNSTATLEDSLAASYKIEHTLLYNPTVTLLNTRIS